MSKPPLNRPDESSMTGALTIEICRIYDDNFRMHNQPPLVAVEMSADPEPPYRGGSYWQVSALISRGAHPRRA